MGGGKPFFRGRTRACLYPVHGKMQIRYPPGQIAQLASHSLSRKQALRRRFREPQPSTSRATKQPCHISFIYLSCLLLPRAPSSICPAATTDRLASGSSSSRSFFVSMFVISRPSPAPWDMDQARTSRHYRLRAAATVTLYTGVVCPFCPRVRRRLRRFQSRMVSCRMRWTLLQTGSADLPGCSRPARDGTWSGSFGRERHQRTTGRPYGGTRGRAEHSSTVMDACFTIFGASR
jgi:hypothetical protein